MVIGILLLLVLLLLLLFRCLNPKAPPEDPDAHITANAGFENPQYNAAYDGARNDRSQSGVYSPMDLAAGSKSNTNAGNDEYLDVADANDGAYEQNTAHAGTFSSPLYVSTSNGAAADGESDIYRVLHNGARSYQAGNANAQLYSIPMAEDDDGDDGQGVGGFDLPRGRTGTVVAEAASGSYEVVAATDGIYTPAADAADNGVDTYNRINTSGRTGGGGGGGTGGYDHIGTHISSSSSSSSPGRAGNADYDRINRNVGGDNAEESSYHNNSMDFGPTAHTSWDNYDMSSSGYQQVTPAEPKKGVTAGREKQGGGGGGGGGKKKIAGRVSETSVGKKKAAGKASAAAAAPAGVSKSNRAHEPGNYGFAGGGGGGRGGGVGGDGSGGSSGGVVVRGRNQGVSVYQGFNVDEDEEV